MVTFTGFNLHSGTVIVNPGTLATFNGNFNFNGGSFFNLGSTIFNTNVTLQGTDVVCYTDPAATTTVTGAFAVFNTDVYYHNGMALSANAVTINGGAAICFVERLFHIGYRPVCKTTRPTAFQFHPVRPVFIIPEVSPRTIP